MFVSSAWRRKFLAHLFSGDAVDEVDEAIVELLESDGRLTHRDIARVIGLSRSTAAARTRRLLDSGQVVVRGVVHPGVIGLNALAYAALVIDGPAAQVAAQVAERTDVTFVSLVTGPYAVVAELRTSGPGGVAEAVSELRQVKGVVAVDTLSYVELVKDVIGPVGEVVFAVDDTDRALLRVLQEDGRCSYVELGRRVRLSAAGARRRVVNLRQGQVVRVGAVVRHSGSDQHSAMGVGLRLAGPHETVIDAVQALSSVIFVAHTLGRFDVLLTIRAFSPAKLLAVLDEIRAIPGAGAAESWTHLEVVKEIYTSPMLDG